MIARFRCGNEVATNNIWKMEERKRCRTYEEELETIDQLKYCQEVREERKRDEQLLDDTGSGKK